MNSLQQLLFAAWAHPVETVTLVASVVAAWYSVRAYRLKEGLQIRRTLIPSASIASEDNYVHTVTLENMKDRAAIIFGVYAEFGPGRLLEIESFESSPLVLNAFEVWHKEYDPTDAYLVNGQRVRVPAFVYDRNVKLRLVLSTSQGRYNVRDWLRRWHPIADFFRNHTSVLIKPYRMTVDGHGYGENALYLVRTRTPSGERVDVPVYPRDHEIQKFVGIRLTAESLESRASLETFLRLNVKWVQGEQDTLEVLDLRERRQRAFSKLGSEPLALPSIGPFTHYIVGPAYTRWKLWRERRENARRLKGATGRAAKQAEGPSDPSS